MKDRDPIADQHANIAARPKIVRIIARLNVGGPAKHVVWLTQGLQQQFETILVAGTVPPGEEDMGYFAAEMGVVPVFVAEMSREVSLKDLLSAWKLYRLLVREKPDVIHTHTAKAGTVGRVAGFFYRWLTPAAVIGQPRRCKFVHTYHGHIFHSYYGPAKTRLFLTIERLLAWLVTDRIVVISEQQRREINERFGVGKPQQFSVVPLGVDTRRFKNSEQNRNEFRRELNLNDDTILVGIVGRLTEIKNHTLFLNAVVAFEERFAGANREVKFIVLGDGHLRKELEEQARRSGIAGNVLFAGSRRDPENFYPALDIVALTSRNEGTPLTLIEAMANARPVIATAVGGVVDLVGEAEPEQLSASFTICERGMLVKSDDADAFAAGLDHLVKNETLRREMGNRGLQFVTKHYSIDRLLADIQKLYRQLLIDHDLQN